MTKLPEHLQKKIDEIAHTYDQNCWRDESYQYPPETQDSFKEGASAMHSLMLEEMETVIKKLKSVKESVEILAEDYDEDDDSSVGLNPIEVEALLKEALSHYREKIEGVK